jgi:hypothetical protein
VVTLRTSVDEVVEGADGFAQEGPVTTFFRGRDGRSVLDAWALRLASFRTADVLHVRWAPVAGVTVVAAPVGLGSPAEGAGPAEMGGARELLGRGAKAEALRWAV